MNTWQYEMYIDARDIRGSVQRFDSQMSTRGYERASMVLFERVGESFRLEAYYKVVAA